MVVNIRFLICKMTGLNSCSQHGHQKNNPSIVAQDMSKKVAKYGKIWPFGLDGQILTVFCTYLKLRYSDYFF